MRRDLTLFGIMFLIIWAYLWLPQSGIATNFSRSHPIWAWTHGSPEMQRAAARVFEQSIKPGTDVKTVFAMLGPGSQNWRGKTFEDFSGESVIGFNVRSWYNFGLDIHYRDGKVISVMIYD